MATYNYPSQEMIVHLINEKLQRLNKKYDIAKAFISDDAINTRFQQKCGMPTQNSIIKIAVDKRILPACFEITKTKDGKMGVVINEMFVEAY